ANKQLRAIREPAAVEPLARILGDHKGPVDDRKLLVEVLGLIDHPESTDAILKIAMGDPQVDVRDVAIEAIKPRKNPSLLKKLVGYLKDNDNKKVNHSAAILAEVGDMSVVPDLIEALETKHTWTKEPVFGQGMIDATKPFTLHQTVILP